MARHDEGARVLLDGMAYVLVDGVLLGQVLVPGMTFQPVDFDGLDRPMRERAEAVRAALQLLAVQQIITEAEVIALPALAAARAFGASFNDTTLEG